MHGSWNGRTIRRVVAVIVACLGMVGGSLGGAVAAEAGPQGHLGPVADARAVPRASNHDGVGAARIGAIGATTGPRAGAESTVRPATPETSNVPQVADTVDLLNDTVVPGNYLAPEGGNGPLGVAYDSGKGEIFVSSSGSDVVSVINDTTDEVVATIPVASYPRGMAYDSGTSQVFVANSPSVTVLNDSTNSVVATVPVVTGSEPCGVAYDPLQGYVFVSEEGADSVIVINDSNDAVQALIPVGSDPCGIAYEQSENEVAVANYGSSNVSLIGAVSLTVLHTVSVGAGPSSAAVDSPEDEFYVTSVETKSVYVISDGSVVVAELGTGISPESLAYDPDNLQMYVSNEGSENLTRLDGLTNQNEGGGIPVGSGPIPLVYDGGATKIFVAEFSSGNVTVVSPTSETAVASIGLAVYPEGVTYDDGTGQFFVAVPAYLPNSPGVVQVFSAGTGALAATIPVQDEPNAMAYDPSRGEVFVADLGSDNVSVINDTLDSVTTTIPVGVEPNQLTYDRGTNEVFVSNQVSNNVSVISAATDLVVANVPVGDGPEGIAYDSATHEVFVADLDSGNVSVISDASNTVVATIPFTAEINAIAYDSAKGELFVTDFKASEVSVVSDVTDSIVATIEVGQRPWSLTYETGQDEVVVANENSGNVSVISDSTDTVTATVTVGAGPIGVAYDPARGITAVSDDDQGTLSLIGQSLPPPAFPVTFTEAALPLGDTWYVNITGQSPMSAQVSSGGGTSLETNLTNATYPFTVATNDKTWSPAYTSPVVIDGLPVSVAVMFHELTYAVSFSEDGLPSGDTWSVTFAGTPLSETTNGGTDTLSVGAEPNGSYPFAVAPVPGYGADPAGGTLVVAGASQTQDVSFTPVLGPGQFLVTFEESGLPAGTIWNVSLNGSMLSASSTTMSFTEINGSYPFTVTAGSGYAPTPARGSVDVRGAAVVQSIVFTSSSPGSPKGTSPSTILGLPADEGYALLVGVPLAALLALLGVVYLRRRRKAPPFADPPAGATPPP